MLFAVDFAPKKEDSVDWKIRKRSYRAIVKKDIFEFKKNKKMKNRDYTRSVAKIAISRKKNSERTVKTTIIDVPFLMLALNDVR